MLAFVKTMLQGILITLNVLLVFIYGMAVYRDEENRRINIICLILWTITTTLNVLNYCL